METPFAAKRGDLLPHAISGQMSDASSELNRAESGATAGRAPSAKSDTLRQWSSAVRCGDDVQEVGTSSPPQAGSVLCRHVSMHVSSQLFCFCACRKVSVALDVVNRFMALRDTAGSAYIAPSRLKNVRSFAHDGGTVSDVVHCRSQRASE
jgi:hypothetical protein